MNNLVATVEISEELLQELLVEVLEEARKEEEKQLIIDSLRLLDLGVIGKVITDEDGDKYVTESDYHFFPPIVSIMVLRLFFRFTEELTEDIILDILSIEYAKGKIDVIGKEEVREVGKEKFKDVANGTGYHCDSNYYFVQNQVNTLGLRRFYRLPYPIISTRIFHSKSLVIEDVLWWKWWKKKMRVELSFKSLDDSWLAPSGDLLYGKWIWPSVFNRWTFNETRWWNKVKNRQTVISFANTLGDRYRFYYEDLKKYRSSQHKGNRRNKNKQREIDFALDELISSANIISDFLSHNDYRHFQRKEVQRVIRMGIPFEEWNEIKDLPEFKMISTFDESEDDSYKSSEDESDDEMGMDDDLNDDSDCDDCEEY